MNRLFRASLPGSYRFPLRGDGTQSREFTFVEDVVEATIRAGLHLDDSQLEPLDIGGGVSASLNEVINMVQEITGSKTRIDKHPLPPGDPKVTTASTASVKRLLGWEATTSLMEGLKKQHLSLAQELVPTL